MHNHPPATSKWWVLFLLFLFGFTLKEFKWVFKYLHCVPNNMENTTKPLGRGIVFGNVFFHHKSYFTDWKERKCTFCFKTYTKKLSVSLFFHCYWIKSILKMKINWMKGCYIWHLNIYSFTVQKKSSEVSFNIKPNTSPKTKCADLCEQVITALKNQMFSRCIAWC